MSENFNGSILPRRTPTPTSTPTPSPSPTPSPTQAQAQARTGGRTLARRSRGTGIALLEALIAIALLALGATGLLNWQFQLRLATDEVRHQHEALQLMRHALERLRMPGAVPDAASTTSPGPSTVVDLQADSTAFVMDVPTTGAGGGTNANHGDSLTPPPPLVTLPLRSLRVEARWQDRAGRPQSLDMNTLLLDQDPSLALWLLQADR